MSESLLTAATSKFGQAEVYRVESESHPVSFESNKLKEIMRRDTSGVALRVIDDKRIGFTSTTNSQREMEMLDRAGSLAPFGSEAFLNFPEPTEYPPVDIFDPAVPKIIKICATRRTEPCAHFQPIGLDQVQRPQYPIKT